VFQHITSWSIDSCIYLTVQLGTHQQFIVSEMFLECSGKKLMKKMKKYLFLECSGKTLMKKNEKILVLGMLRKKLMKKMKKY